MSSYLSSLCPSSIASCFACEVKYKSKCCEENTCAFCDCSFKKKNYDIRTDVECCDIFSIKRSMTNSVTPVMGGSQEIVENKH